MTAAMGRGRQADTDRRRERVATAVTAAVHAGEPVTAAGIARAAAVDRSFLYRHRDLLTSIHTAQTSPPPTPGSAPSPPVSVASLQADLANAHSRATRQDAHIRKLENKLSDLLGHEAWAQSGLGDREDVTVLNRRIRKLETQLAELTARSEERNQELDAARASNRQLMTDLNAALKQP